MALRALQGPAGGAAPVGGSGTTNYIPRWNPGPSTLGDSGLIDNGTVIGVANGTRTLAFNLLQISGNTLTTSTAELALQYATSRDTTVYAPGSSIALIVKGTTGNVGIGTASPNAILSVYNAGTPTISLWNSTNFSRFATSANDLYIDAGLGGVAGATVFRRGSGTVESARIDSSGNVGIGTASPAGRLDVVGVAASLGWAIRAQVNSANTSPALNAELGFNLKNTSATVGNYTSITNRDSSDNANTQINFINVNNSGSGAINFVTRDSAGGPAAERARIDSSGNLILNTANTISDIQKFLFGQIQPSN